MDKKKILIVTGPTATGKTALALEMAKKFDGEIISADSRQVYKFMNFGTGKDLPTDAKFIDKNSELIGKNLDYNFGCYFFNGIPVWGLDIVTPDKNFTAYDFVTYANLIIENIQSRNKLPIVVGGTGLYLRGLLGEIETLSIETNSQRSELENLTLDQLQEKLQSNSIETWEKMNESDQKNPRRLIRAIEVSLGDKKKNVPFPKYNPLILVLTAPIEKIIGKIEKRDRGEIVKEIKKLLDQNYHPNLPSMTGLAYKSFRPYFEKIQDDSITESEKNDGFQIWNREDKNYARRQLTFLKKYFPESDSGEKLTHWLDITKKGWKGQATELIYKWYIDANEKEAETGLN